MTPRMVTFASGLLALILLQASWTGISSLADAASQDSSALFERNGMPYELFDELPGTPIKVMDSEVDVAFASGDLDLTHAQVLKWISTAAHSVAAYYGHFPVKRVRVLVIPVTGQGTHGVSFGYKGAATKISLGKSTTEKYLQRDWVMTHEMVHMTFPLLPDTYSWIGEGIATYVEPIARAQVGQISVEKVWADMLSGLPQGLPKAGDRGLDHTHTWGRTYWGGALFCLLADVRIRERTHNRYGLQDALRAIAAAGGTIESTAELSYIFKVGDDAVGVPVLTELYRQMKDTPVVTDLPDLWQRLGVEMQGDGVIFNDAAPLAAIRQVITRAPLPPDLAVPAVSAKTVRAKPST